MRTIDVIQGSSNRNQTLRLLMLLIVVGTFPFYCIGIIIIGSAPVAGVATIQRQTEDSAATFTPLGAGLVPSLTSSWPPTQLVTRTPINILRPTPRQFIPPPISAPTSIAVQTLVTSAPTPFISPPTSLPTATASVSDADDDGVLDQLDRCPNEFGYADNNGCPYPDDPDRDGIRGDADFCPREFAPGSPRGCRDFDGDGLDSYDDDCPDEPGPVSNRGCP